MSLSQPALAGNRGPDVRQLTLFPVPASAAIDTAAVLEVDPCRHRHKGAETSVQAHDRIKPHKRAVHEKIIALARDRGQEGATVHELAAELQTFPSSISGRLFELRTLGRLAYKLDGAGARVKRRGACVLVATEAE